MKALSMSRTTQIAIIVITIIAVALTMKLGVTPHDDNSEGGAVSIISVAISVAIFIAFSVTMLQKDINSLLAVVWMGIFMLNLTAAYLTGSVVSLVTALLNAICVGIFTYISILVAERKQLEEE